MSQAIPVTTPLTAAMVTGLKAGDRVSISGEVFAARDAAHQRLIELLERGQELPLELEGQLIYYVGPAPPRPGRAEGSAGPTSSYRMDPYTPQLLARGLRGMLGKGRRGPEVVEAMQKYGAVYFAATGGAGALISKAIVASEIIAYPDLGPEAIRRLTVKELPAIVAIDSQGGDLYASEPEKYRL
jgi:fumarate hydratase subunit beta